MRSREVSIQFCGFGGQGLILAATVLGAAAVSSGLRGVQTQSFGSEARGGECQAQLVLSAERINSPVASEVDILVAMSPEGLARYLPRLRRGGVLVMDPQYVAPPQGHSARAEAIPATELASTKLGNRLAANMVLLGYLVEATGIVPWAALEASIRQNVPERFVELNVCAANEGRTWTMGRSARLEV